MRTWWTLFGNAEAVAHGNAFYGYLTEEHGLAKKAVLEGMSRGGRSVRARMSLRDKTLMLFGNT